MGGGGARVSLQMTFTVSGIFPLVCLFLQGAYYNTLDFWRNSWGLHIHLEGRVCATVLKDIQSYWRMPNISLDQWQLFRPLVDPYWLVYCYDHPNFWACNMLLYDLMGIVPVYLLRTDNDVLRGCTITELPSIQCTVFFLVYFFLFF